MSCNPEQTISVLVTFYNQEDCVKRALDSILSQEISAPVEVLVGDDGSSDSTWDIVQDYVQGSANVQAFKMSRDDGVVGSIARASRNRLKLLDEATGEYLVFLDGDDYFPDPHKLQRQFDALESDHGLAACMHNFEYVDETGKRLSAAYLDTNSSATISFTDFWSAGYLPASCFMFRKPSKEALSSINRDNFDDNTIVFPLVEGDRLLYMGDVMFSYVQQDDSTWNSLPLADRIIVNQKDYFQEMASKPFLASMSTVRHSFEIACLALLSKQKLKATRQLAEQRHLFEEEGFSKIWSRLMERKFPANCPERIRLLGMACVPSFKKVVRRRRLNRTLNKQVD